jgi:hypothetical protein
MFNGFKNLYSNKFKFFVVLAALATLSLVAVVIAQKISKKETVEILKPLPKGNWSVVYHPYLADDYLKSPIIVHSVSSKHFEAGRIEIQNISNKPVKAIKVGWILYYDQDRKKFLKQGHTKLLNFKNNLLGGKMGFINYGFVSFTDFSKEFLVNGELNKDFDVDVLVDEVEFTDGSSWKMSEGVPADINQEILSKITSNIFECAKQKCVGRPSTTRNGGVTYSCGPSDLTERCVVNGDWACTNQSCSAPGGGINPNLVSDDDEIIVE